MGNKTRQACAANPWLKRVSRASAWVLLAGVAVLVFSGWGITQTGAIYNSTFGAVDRKMADAIHRAANFPLALFFLVHVLINLKLNLSCNHPSRAWLTNGILIVVGMVLVGIVAYMEYFRGGG
jgi:cytochrome b subunit of formate dehydrogenase